LFTQLNDPEYGKKGRCPQNKSFHPDGSGTGIDNIWWRVYSRPANLTMKKHLIFIVFVILSAPFLTGSAAKAPAAPAEERFGLFYSSLSPYGEWIEVQGGLRVWHPQGTSPEWRPYLLGQWAWTDYGWYWVSSEPFGWATYHYGRWYRDDYYGWVWVPDDVWGPGWVEWRNDDSYVGWAPLPPYATFSVTVGIRFTRAWSAPPVYWNFVTYRSFGGPIEYRTVARVDYVERLLPRTRSSGRYEVDRARIINRGVDRAVIERRGFVRVERTDVREVSDVHSERLTRESGVQRVEMFRPSPVELNRSTAPATFRTGDRKISLELNRVERARTRQIQRAEPVVPPATGRRSGPPVRYSPQGFRGAPAYAHPGPNIIRSPPLNPARSKGRPNRQAPRSERTRRRG